MSTIEEMAQEIEAEAKRLNITSDEYIKCCNDMLCTFNSCASELFSDLTAKQDNIQAKNKALRKRMAMGTRRTHGDF